MFQKGKQAQPLHYHILFVAEVKSAWGLGQQGEKVRGTVSIWHKKTAKDGTLHAKMGTIKDKNGKDLTEAEERWQEYTELYKKDVNDPDNHHSVFTHLELDILECEVKWTLGSITMNKASGSNGIPAEIFQILKDNAVKVLHSCQQIWEIKKGSYC